MREDAQAAAAQELQPALLQRCGAGPRRPGYLKGNEPVVIVNASTTGRLAFSLPGQAAPAVTVVRADGGHAKPEMCLDTIILDTDAQQVLLLWWGHVVLSECLHDVRDLHVTVEGLSSPKQG
ncbi:DUF2169 domain-containing protein [Cystobacter ferrugineus]|uniref:DUF2169 domain-containing protein n=1 Tax=Cystobacter ferrugineus TaxID=83449 RepID=UPI0009042B96|nr:DUF2169 domain-containing protein [Cystobacter ferrugineus]